jgi:multicomponent Na+:H+ antiporter subunit F
VHEAISWVAIGWTFGLVAVTTALVFRSRSLLSRVLALDTLALLLIALLVLVGDWRQSPHYLDAALAVALLSFVGTLAAVRYHGGGDLFS